MPKKKEEKEEEKIEYSKYEKARMIGSRALQIAQGAPFMIKLTKKDLEKLRYDPVKIATLEFNAGVIPLTVKRPLPEKKKKEEESS